MNDKDMTQPIPKEKIENITRELCRRLRDDIDAVLKPLGAQLGVKFHAGNASYTDNTVTFKLEAMIEGFDKVKAEYEQACIAFRLRKDQYGTPFKWGGNNYTLAGLSMRSSKYPIIAERDNGKRYKLPERAIMALQTERPGL